MIDPRYYDPTLNRMLGLPLSPREQQALETLVGDPNGKTYPQTARVMGISMGTLHAYLSRAKHKQPDRYKAMMQSRKTQLKRRHELALARSAKHSQAFFKRRGKTMLERVVDFKVSLSKH